jgi:ComF family protein
MLCGKPLSDSRQEYCDDCRRKKHVFLQGRSLFSYQGEIRKSLYRLKYSNRREYALCYGQEMARNLGPWILQKKITRIVPIPLHPSRKRQRGYNQAALLAKSLGEALEIPVDETLLCRVKRTKPQKNLSGQERKANLKHAFQVKKEILPGECILLVDDIFTTGSTVDAAAQCLINHFGCRVYVITVAIGG